MKECGQVILTAHGRERTFSEQELIAILERHFYIAEVTHVPTEGKEFEVNPQAIDQSLFQQKRENEKQERTRKLIMEALDNVKSNPEKYGKKFITFIPVKTWEFKTIEELKQLACELGDHNADWVEQALEWAQRISNGELWEAVCNNADTANWNRLVVWKNDHVRFVGGSLKNLNYMPSSFVYGFDCDSNYRFKDVVPLVVRYEK